MKIIIDITDKTKAEIAGLVLDFNTNGCACTRTATQLTVLTPEKPLAERGSEALQALSTKAHNAAASLGARLAKWGEKK